MSAGVVEVVRGQLNAAATMRRFEDCQTSEDRHAGWRYFLEETELKPGMDPKQATQQRWADLETRESRAMNQLNSETSRRS